MDCMDPDVRWSPKRPLNLITHSLIHSFTYSLIHSFTHSLIHSLTHSLTHSPLTHSLTHSPILAKLLFKPMLDCCQLQWTTRKNFGEIWIKIQHVSFTKMHLEISSAKWQPFWPRDDELICPYSSWLLHWDWAIISYIRRSTTKVTMRTKWHYCPIHNHNTGNSTGCSTICPG